MFSRFHPKEFLTFEHTGQQKETKHTHTKIYTALRVPEKFVINFLLLLLLFPAFHSFRSDSFSSSSSVLLLLLFFVAVVPGTIYFWLINPLKYIGSRTNRYGYFAVAQIQMLNTVNKRE